VLPIEFAWSYRIDTAPTSAPPAGLSLADGDRPPVPRAAASAADSTPRHPTRVVIANAEPPASLGVARLLPWGSAEAPDVLLDGPAATPSRALEEFADATFIEIHAHGVVDASGSGDSFVMLSPDRDGQYALTATAIRGQRLRGSPIVILAACHAAATATYRHEAWGLPAAFIAGGARAVIASIGVIDDADAGAFFDDVRGHIERGAPSAIALRDARVAWLTTHPAAAWVRSLMVFQ
jgi:CHAT domain-containing protein